MTVKLCDKFVQKVCSGCEDNNLCKKDMSQIQACATIEIWNLMSKNDI